MNGKHEGEKDELEKHITLLSSKISYYLLLLLMLIVLVVSEKVIALNDIKNIPLVIVIGLAWNAYYRIRCFKKISLILNERSALVKQGFITYTKINPITFPN